MTTPGGARPPGRRRGSALRDLGAMVASLAVLVVAAWGTERLSPSSWPAAPPRPLVASPASAPSPAVVLPPMRARPPVAVAPVAAPPVAAPPVAEAPDDSTRLTAPLEHVLRRYSSDRALTRRIAAAVLREGERAKIDPTLIVAVLVAENDVLKPEARNRTTSAQGLMQVMPAWAGRLGCASSDLSDVDANICHGVRVLAAHVKEAQGDLREGLRLYNGCRRRNGSTRCDAYPARVLAHAERLEGQITSFSRLRRAGPSRGDR
jgi:soluble lytic murein transglycosylase-like protein